MSISFFIGVSFLPEVLAGLITRHDTPPSQTASPISRHSSAAPPDPRIVTAPDAATAMAELHLPPWRAGAVASRLATEEPGADGRVETRQDRPIDRERWHFGPRSVRILVCHIAPEVVA